MTAKKTAAKAATKPADASKTDELKPATDTAASGALVEPDIAERIDTDHPAIDDEPRKGQPVAANRIDLNDPAKSDGETVAERLKDQSED